MTISSLNGAYGNCNSSGIVSFKINNAGHLIVQYTDNTIEDLGRVVGYDGHDGKNFYPTEIGGVVPDANFKVEWEMGESYLYLDATTAILYFKTSAKGITPVTWTAVEFGKGPKGDRGNSFKIDGSGTDLPVFTDNLPDGYFFYKTDEGFVYQWNKATSTWSKFQYRGDKGDRGNFIIDATGNTIPQSQPISLDDPAVKVGFTYLDTSTGLIYQVIINPADPTKKMWSQGYQWQGLKGKDGENGEDGKPGKDAAVGSYMVENEIDTSYPNALLVVGKCPAGYVITHIQVDVLEAFNSPVDQMKVRFGGTMQSMIDGIDIAPYDYFDIHRVTRFIVDEVAHEPSANEEIISCIFDDSVNNSNFGKLKIKILMSYVGERTPIEYHI